MDKIILMSIFATMMSLAFIYVCMQLHNANIEITKRQSIIEGFRIRNNELTQSNTGLIEAIKLERINNNGLRQNLIKIAKTVETNIEAITNGELFLNLLYNYNLVPVELFGLLSILINKSEQNTSLTNVLFTDDYLKSLNSNIRIEIDYNNNMFKLIKIEKQ